MSTTTMFRRVFAPNTKAYLHSKPRRPRLGFDTLEKRDCPATASLSGGVLSVMGSDISETITVNQNGSWINVVGGQTYHESAVAKIVIRGFGGHDTLRNNTNKNSVMYGEGGSDTLFGGNGTDQLIGGTNNDFLYGGNGNDDLYGQQGNDYLYGAHGTDGYETGNTNDTLQGGDGFDYMYGGYGNDFLVGGNDNDWIRGQWGDDMVVGANWDFVYHRPDAVETVTAAGYTTNDTLFGENGNDKIYGGYGHDDMSGGYDSDLMYGEYGNDRMSGAFLDSPIERTGSANDDTLFGGNGNDTLRGGAGEDWLWGENHDDGLYGEDGHDALDGGSGGDNLEGGIGNDNLVGGEGLDFLTGGADHDTLFGAAWLSNYTYQDASNYLFGNDGNDNLYGGNGYDYMDAGNGNDGLFGGADDIQDYMIGGANADRVLMTGNPAAGNTSYALDETAVDFNDEDAELIFLNGYDVTVTHSPTETATYTAQNWTDADVVRSDAVYGLLHREGRGVRLLKTPTGGSIVLVRHGTTNRGYNGAGWMHMTDADTQFGGPDVNLRGYLLHEIAHYWQGSAFGGTSNWNSFLGLSGWTTTNPNSAEFTLSTNEGNGNRWYQNTATFASDYARTNEDEDFCESFAAYFTQRAGWAWYNTGTGAAAIPAKMNMFTNWVAGF